MTLAMRSVWLPAAAIGIATLVTTGIFLLRRKSSEPYIEGAIYSVRAEQGFGVVKVLMIEPAAIHIRLYKNKFKQRPEKIDVSTFDAGNNSRLRWFWHRPSTTLAKGLRWVETDVHAKEFAFKGRTGRYEDWQRLQGRVWDEAN